MKVSKRIKWFTVSLFSWNPVCMLVIRPFDSRYHVSLLLIIHSIVLQRQLVNGLIVLWIRRIFACFGDGNNYSLSSNFWERTTCPDVIKDIQQALDRFVW